MSESTFATLPRTTRGVPIVLGGDPKGKNFLYTNGTSVVIRDIAVCIRVSFFASIDVNTCDCFSFLLSFGPTNLPYMTSL